MAQPRYPLNSQVLAIFFPFATKPPMPHYPEFTDRYSSQYSMLMFLMHFMTNTFSRYSFLSPSSTFTLFLNYKASLILFTRPSLTKSQQLYLHFSSVIHLIQAESGLKGQCSWVDSYFSLHTCCLNSENQGTIDNRLWRRYLQFEW